MKDIKLLDYPVWRLSWSAYGERQGYDLSQTEATCQWFDDHGSFEDRVESNRERFSYTERDAIEDARLEARIEAQEEYEDQPRLYDDE